MERLKPIFDSTNEPVLNSNLVSRVRSYVLNQLNLREVQTLSASTSISRVIEENEATIRIAVVDHNLRNTTSGIIVSTFFNKVDRVQAIRSD